VLENKRWEERRVEKDECGKWTHHAIIRWNKKGLGPAKIQENMGLGPTKFKKICGYEPKNLDVFPRK
jgi:hypothetical protein